MAEETTDVKAVSLSEAKQSAPIIQIDRLEIATDGYVIDTAEEYQRGGEILKSIAQARRIWKGHWENPATGPVALAKALLDSLRDIENTMIKRLDACRETVEKQMSAWSEKHDQIETDRATKLQALADETRKNLLLQGNIAAAEMVPIVPYQPAAAPKLAGVPAVDSTEVVITDLMALVKAVAFGEVPLMGRSQGKDRPVFEVREAVLTEMRKSLGESFSPPGVEFRKSKSFRPRSK